MIMIFSTIVLWPVVTFARAQTPPGDGVQPINATRSSGPIAPLPWSLANISLTIVDHSTPQENMQIGFHIDYPNKTATPESRCQTAPSGGPMKQWKFCSYEGLHIRTKNVVVAETVEFDLDLLKYSWKK
jgi:hypothetical protein